MPLNLDAYLARIGWSGPLAADFATVAGLLDRHVLAIPFENLDATSRGSVGATSTSMSKRSASRQIPEWT